MGIRATFFKDSTAFTVDIPTKNPLRSWVGLEPSILDSEARTDAGRRVKVTGGGAAGLWKLVPQSGLGEGVQVSTLQRGKLAAGLLEAAPDAGILSGTQESEEQVSGMGAVCKWG